MDDKGYLLSTYGILSNKEQNSMRGFVSALLVIKKGETYIYLSERKESSGMREPEVQKSTNYQEAGHQEPRKNICPYLRKVTYGKHECTDKYILFGNRV